MPDLRFKCANRVCRTVLTVPPSYGGQQVRCSCCGKMMRAPAGPQRNTRPKKRSRAA